MQQIQLPPISEGETYLCGRIDKAGEVEHTVIVAINDEKRSLKAQREWAQGLGAVLMNRIEALVINAEHRDLVKEETYWTDEEVEWDSSYAWCQNFSYGDQNYTRKGSALRAVAVRRFKN